MDEISKLYTVEDIAKMTHLTTHTIRNYIKDGLLKGSKIGGQWRFTAKNIEDLYESGSEKAKGEKNIVQQDIIDSQYQEVYDFLNGVNSDMEGEIQVCSIADVYCNSNEEAKKICDRIITTINEKDFQENRRFFYNYLKEESKARFILLGPLDFVNESLTRLKENK